MKSGIRILAVLVAFAAAVCAQTPSVADVARQERAKPKPKNVKVWTNDDFPSTQPVTTTETEKPAAEAAEPGEAGKAATAAKSAGEPEKDAAKEKQKAIAEWQKHLADQKTQIAKLEQEISTLETQQQERASTYYTDAGTRLRNDEKWTKDQMKNDTELAQKKQALVDAKSKLSDMQDQARKAGVPHPYD